MQKARTGSTNRFWPQSKVRVVQLGSAFNWKFEKLCRTGKLFFRLHFKRNAALRYCLAPGAVEILVNRKEGMWLQLAKCFTQPLLNPVYLMKESPTIETQFPAAELPIGTQQEVVFEDAVLTLTEGSPAYQTKVCDELLILQTPNGSALPARIRLQGHAANVLLLRRTLLKARIAGAENGSEHTIARCGISAPSWSQTETIADTARLLR
jgi:hypothetical protein